MDASHRLWQDDYRREVDEVLARMRADKHRSSTSPVAEAGLIDIVLPPAGLAEDLRAARERLSRLETLLQEAREKLSKDSSELEREKRRRERLKQLVIKLHWTANKLDAERREALDKSAESAARMAELGERLREAVERTREAGVHAETERARALKWSQDARVLQGRLDELQLRLDQSRQGQEAAERRLQAALAAHEERAGEAEARRRELEDRADAAQRERAAAREELSAAKREAQLARDEAASLMARLDQALGELKHGREGSGRAAELEIKIGALESDLEQSRLRLKDALVESAKAATAAAVSRKDAEGARATVRELEAKLDSFSAEIAALTARALAAERLLAEAKAVSDRRLDAVMNEDGACQAELAELRAAHERDRQKIVEDCSEALETAKRFMAARRAEGSPPASAAAAPQAQTGFLSRLFGRKNG